MAEIIFDNKFYKIEKVEGKYVAEFKSESLGGVPGINFRLDDTVEARMQARANKIVADFLFPKDPKARELKAKFDQIVKPQQPQLSF